MQCWRHWRKHQRWCRVGRHVSVVTLQGGHRQDRTASATRDRDTPEPPSFPGQLRPGSDTSLSGMMLPGFPATATSSSALSPATEVSEPRGAQRPRPLSHTPEMAGDSETARLLILPLLPSCDHSVFPPLLYASDATKETEEASQDPKAPSVPPQPSGQEAALPGRKSRQRPTQGAWV